MRRIYQITYSFIFACVSLLVPQPSHAAPDFFYQTWDVVVGRGHWEQVGFGEASYSRWFMSSGDAVPGLEFPLQHFQGGSNAILTLSGVPLTPGTFTRTYETNNFFGNPTKKWIITINVTRPDIQIGPDKLVDGKVGLAYATQTITATGGTGPYTFKTSGTLPPGLTLNASTGAFSGTPTTAGTYTFWLGATDSEGFGGEATGTNGWRQYTLTIAPRPTITITPTSLDNGKVGLAYATKTITATGGTGPYTFKTSGTLPP
ncbi:Ig domain-containing protein, partial [Brucella pseudintermedia]|uniref:Ig domain-containing protein n=3 Tax=Brucella pseudintermedia TaxID=370111 RepID=UPI00320A9E1C